jgi:hypothetical protein
MSAEDAIRILFGRGREGSRPLDCEEWKRVAARTAWVRETMAAWAEAQRAMDDRSGEAVERVSADEFERIFDEEQAKVDAIRALIDDVIERDVWPRELYWGGV